MSRPLRLEHPGSLWHVTARGNEKRSIVYDESDRTMFHDLLGEATTRFGWILDSYALMTNHYHLVLELTRRTLSSGMHWLNGTYARRFNRKHDRVGHLFQSRFGAILIEKESHSREVLRYVVLNPVRAGIVSHPAQSDWTSYRAIAGLAPAPPWLAAREVLRGFGPDVRIARSEYRRFVEAGIGGTERPWDQTVGQIYLGSEPWIQKVRDEIAMRPRSDDVPRRQLMPFTAPMAVVIATVAANAGMTEEAIRHGRGGVERMIAAWIGRYDANLDLRSIAAGLRLRSASHASALIRRCDQMLRSDNSVQSMLARCQASLRPVAKPQTAGLTP